MSSMSYAAADLFNLDGAIAVVTGGGTGIGLMAARSLAANGAKVYIIGRRLEVIENSAKIHSNDIRGSLVALQGDLSSKEDVARMATKIPEGRIHILVNNAGITGIDTSLGDEPEKLTAKEISERHISNREESYEVWSRIFHMNSHSLFFATMAFLPLLEQGNKVPPTRKTTWSSSVINVTSVSGILRASQDHYAYNASKASANALSLMIAHELNFRSKVNIRVNAIAPGVFATEMTVFSPSKDGVSDPNNLKPMINPAGRAGEEGEMATGILFLATNTFVNGQIVAVDGGFATALPAWH